MAQAYVDNTAEEASAIAWVRHDTKSKKGQEKNRPSPRSGHSMNVVGASAFLFGGMSQMKDTTSDDPDEITAQASPELYRLQLVSGEGMEWERINTPGTARPLSRWKHTATLFENTQILVFGGYHTTEHRLNDVWVFDAVAYCWTQPNSDHNQDSNTASQLSNEKWANVPPPRGGHSATLIGENVYIFGGYGGLGYSRRDLDDLYALNVFTWVWSKVAAKGTFPEKRSGHNGTTVDKKMYVFGGSSSSGQFNDLHVLDTELDPPVWSKLACSLPTPTWNQAACSVVAIPTWKVFTFGGMTGTLSDQDRQGQAVNSVAILDTGAGKWTMPQIEGKGPLPRCDTCMAYDPKGSRLIVFGGWSVAWHGDVYTLDVGNIVGPPYAVTDILPNMGPVTGGTEITIIGIDFINTQDVLVRFGNAKQGVDVRGTYISQTKISCISPDFTRFSTSTVDVRVALDGDSFTTTFQRFSFFSVTNHAACIMFGPGLLSGCALHEEVSFLIQARDDNLQNRVSGKDEFFASVALLSDNSDDPPQRLPGVKVQDLNNGRYIVTYTVKFPGRYEVKVDFMGTFGGAAGPVRGSGVVIEFDPKAPKDNNRMSGDLVVRTVKRDIVSLQEFTDELIKTIFVRVKDDTWSNEEQIRVLMNVKEALLRAEAAATETNLLVDRCECILGYFREQDVLIPGLDDALANGKAAWERIVRDAPGIQNKISPMMRAHGGKIRTDIQAYEAHVTAYKEGIAKSEFYVFATGPFKAISLIDAADAAQLAQKSVTEKMLHIANVFECVKDMDGAVALIAEVGDMLKDVRNLWQCNKQITQEIDYNKNVTWKDLDTDALEETAKTLVQTMRKLPKSTRASDAFKVCLPNVYFSMPVKVRTYRNDKS